MAVGTSAYIIYKKKKLDDKKDAATILLTEIRNAAVLVPGLRDRFTTNKNAAVGEDLKLLPSESWSRFKYLFVNELSDQEWQGIDKFFKNCLAYDECAHENRGYFANDTQQIWVNIQAYYARVLRKFMDTNPPTIMDTQKGRLAEIPQSDRDKVRAYTDTYIANTALASYSPSKPINEAERALNNIHEEILITSAGIALEKITKSKLFHF